MSQIAGTGSPVRDQKNCALLDNYNIICFSHLRWNFVFQRPQHLMSRFSGANRVIYWEEPVYLSDQATPNLNLCDCLATGVLIATPQLCAGEDRANDAAILKGLLDKLVASLSGPLVRWYYTPMMLPFSAHVAADRVIYDCMDELANFKNSPPELLRLEQQLLDAADVVFTGGYSLYEAKRDRHPNVHAFPSSVDVSHFAAARALGEDPADQAAIRHPRLGFYGVVDERMDIDLLASIADSRPEWSLVIVGPIVKIDPADLPRRPNIHYLGGKKYEELPAYLRGWDVALMPFAINDATRFISPTKTPEYLAGGRPVVSTPITDVIRHYSQLPGVWIAGNEDEFVRFCQNAITLRAGSKEWLGKVDGMLSQTSWDKTFARMAELIKQGRKCERIEPIVSPTIWPARRKAYDYMIVGAGFAGAVMAERLARGSGKKVLVVDRRPHVAGNAFDRLDDAGVLIHQYGPHIFHTNSQEIVDYLSRFTDWRPYEHRVLASVGDRLVPIPINRTTLNAIYELQLKDDKQAQEFLTSRAEPVTEIRTSEDVVVAAVGRDLYEKFFQGYTRKQWGMDPSELDKSVTARVPTRTNIDDRYFADSFQAMPASGFTRMFENMLDHPNIDLLLGVEYRDARVAYAHEHLVFTGPIDEYFSYRFGKLPYRSLSFHHETVDQQWYQPVAVVNYPSPDVPYTRVTEYKHLTGQSHPRSSITFEFPCAEGDPYYPVPRAENQLLFKRYEALSLAEADVTFVGRLATYRYYNMDQVVGQALSTYRRLVNGAAQVRPARVASPAGQLVQAG